MSITAKRNTAVIVGIVVAILGFAATANLGATRLVGPFGIILGFGVLAIGASCSRHDYRGVILWCGMISGRSTDNVVYEVRLSNVSKGFHLPDHLLEQWQSAGYGSDQNIEIVSYFSPLWSWAKLRMTIHEFRRC